MWRAIKSRSALVSLAFAGCAAAAACGESRPPSHVFMAGTGGTVMLTPPATGGSILFPSGGGNRDDLTSCAEGVALPAPLTRWSILDLDRTLDDLFGAGRTLASSVPINDQRYVRDLSLGFVGALRLVARERAQSAVADTEMFEVCESDDSDAACIQPFLRDWGEKLYRRPLTPEQLEAYVAQFTSAQTELTPAEAARNALVSMVLSPYFVLRIELGNPITGQLSSYEVAARLSHFVTRSSPDAELMQSAKSNALLKPIERLQQLHRLWQLPAGRFGRAQQHLEWLDLSEGGLPQVLAPELRAEMFEQSQRFINDVFDTQHATLVDLLGSARLPLTPSLAEHYGLPAPAADGFSFVDGDPTLSSGLLSLGLFVSTYPRPTARGLAIFRGLLCGSVPDHPPNVAADFGDGATPRERITQGIAGRSECRACHDMIDPLGFGLEAFDDQGRMTGFESNAIVRATSTGVSFEANNPAELGRGIAASQSAATCAARHYLETVLDRELTPAISAAGSVSHGPPPIPIQHDTPETMWINCLAQPGLAGPFNLQYAIERLVQSTAFLERYASGVHVVALDTSVNPLDHAAQETSLLVGSFFDPQDNEKLSAYATTLSELKRLDTLGPGGDGGAAGAYNGGAAGESAGGNGTSGAP